MYWLGDGIVRIPLRHIYLCAIVLLVAYFIAREVVMSRRRTQQANCEGFEQTLLKEAEIRRLAAETKASHLGAKDGDGSDGSRGGDSSNTDDDDDDDDDGDKANVCWKNPIKTSPDTCRECFRPKAYEISKQMQLISHKTLMFPRGPTSFFKLRNEPQQTVVADYLLSPKSVCSRRDLCPYLLAVQLSEAKDYERREAIRSTWGSVAKTQVWPRAHINSVVQLLFVLGNPAGRPDPLGRHFPKGNGGGGGGPSKLWESVKQESEMHRDILYIDMQDSYYNLTLKIVSAFQWVQDHCPGVKFVLKVDTDTFVNVPLLLDILILNEARLRFSVLGTIYTQDRLVHRAGKWAVNSSHYQPPTYPVYASGCTYVISSMAMTQLVDSSAFIPIDRTTAFLGPDVFTTGFMGLLLAFDFYRVPGSELFGRCNGTHWNPCEMIEDDRVFGSLSTNLKDTTNWAKVWRAFYRYYR